MAPVKVDKRTRGEEVVLLQNKEHPGPLGRANIIDF
jgi:hypothetical protein